MRQLISSFPLYLLAIACGSAPASELSYTFVDFRVVSTDLTASGTRSTTPRQEVTVDTEDGDGVSVAGSLALPRGVYLHGAYNSSIIEHQARISSPFAEQRVQDEFDLITSSFGVGYRHELAPRFDLTFEVGYDTAELDFGSLAGEDFDTESSGAAARLGFRWNPFAPFELYAAAGPSPYGKLDLDDGRFDDSEVLNLGLRWYFFPDLGVGFDYQSGDLSALTLSMRFSFGDLPW